MTTQEPGIDVHPDHWRIVQAILERHVPQYDVWAFGSRARFTARRYSDLDIAVITNQTMSLDDVAALKEAFSESDLPWKVDVLDWASLTPAFKDRIAQNKVVIQQASTPTGGARA